MHFFLNPQSSSKFFFLPLLLFLLYLDFDNCYVIAITLSDMKKSTEVLSQWTSSDNNITLCCEGII